MTKHLVTSALPYVAGIKHLGNLAGSLLPADVHARFLRQAGEEVAFICATDEHGTPAELAAAAEGSDVPAYCDRLHHEQADIYRRLDLSFDHFGRTSSPENHRVTQEVYRELDEAGFIEEREIRQIWSPADGRFLPDRYVEGTCPHCGGAARGDQCEACSATLDPEELVAPRSAISGATGLELRPTRHLFLRQSALADRLSEWLETRSGWSAQTLGIARGWLAAGLQDRCITRDLSWGIPVPRQGFEGKTFYVWFDAPLGYISATSEWCRATGREPDDWWGAHADVRHVQFLGKDNVPFHAISFPATLIGAGGRHLADVVKGFNWLNHEGGRFSTSRRRGVFLDQALDLLPADSWRWWLSANAPETADTTFTFDAFAAGVNADLADKLGNLVSRVLGYVSGRLGGVVPDVGEDHPADAALGRRLDEEFAALAHHHRAVEIRKAAERVRVIWDLANGYVANEAPWTVAKTDPARAAAITRNAVGLVRASAIAAHPFIPATARRILALLGEQDAPAWPDGAEDALRLADGLAVERPPILFPKLDAAWVSEQTSRFSGTEGNKTHERS